MAKRNRSNGETAKVERGPSLVWTPERDAALVQTMASGTQITSQIVSALNGHEAFEGEASPVTEQKVRVRIAYLRKAGVKLPKVSRSRYAPDASALNALLAGGGDADADEGDESE